MKKIISVVLLLLMLFSLFGIESFAWGEDLFADMIEKDGIYYLQMDENEVYVFGYELAEEESEPEEIVIPETVNERRKTYTVTGVFDEAFLESNYSKITLPDSVEYIGYGAFMYSEMLEKVVIPDSCEIEYFGADVFIGTPAEGEFFDEDVNVIGKNVLYSYMGSDKKFTIPENINILAAACFMFSGVEEVTFNENVTEIPDLAFCGCRNLKEFAIPDGITYVGDSAFKDCVNLEKVTLGKDVEMLNYGCFTNTKIESIHLGPLVESVEGAFYGCNNLGKITVDEDNEYYYTDENALYSAYEYEYYDDEEVITDTTLSYYFGANTAESYKVKDFVDSIGDYAFYNCKTLKNIDLSGVTFIGTKAFAYSTIESFKLNSDDGCYIAESAFNSCKNLTEADLTSVYSIGTAAFENCTKLENVELNASVYTVDSLAFSNTAIKEIEIYGDDSFIGEDAFKGCKELTNVTLGDGVWFVDSNVFRDCPKLETVYLSKTIELFGENAFQNCEHVNFQVIKGSDAYKEIKALGYDFEVVGKLTLLEQIASFFASIFEVLFGWLYW